MRLARKLCILMLALFVCLSTLAQAEVEMGDSKTLKLEAKPIDMAVSAEAADIRQGTYKSRLNRALTIIKNKLSEKTQD